MSKTKLNHKERRIARTAVRNFINKWSPNRNAAKSTQPKKKSTILTIDFIAIQFILIIIKLFNLINWSWILVLLPTEAPIIMAIIISIFKPFGLKVTLNFPWIDNK